MLGTQPLQELRCCARITSSPNCQTISPLYSLKKEKVLETHTQWQLSNYLWVVTLPRICILILRSFPFLFCVYLKNIHISSSKNCAFFLIFPEPSWMQELWFGCDRLGSPRPTGLCAGFILVFSDGLLLLSSGAALMARISLTPLWASGGGLGCS